MKITRDGKTYELTPGEIKLAGEEYLRNFWRNEIAKAIDRNSSRLSFGLDYSCDEFITACMKIAEEDYNEDNDVEHYDEVVLDTARVLDVAKSEEEEECDCW